MYKLLFILLITLFTACSSTKFYNPAEQVDRSLVDCTEQGSLLEISNPSTNLTQDDRKTILKAASLWAYDINYFLPEIDMCGVVYEHANSQVSVFVTPAGVVSAERNRDIYSAPSATVTFSLPEFELIAQKAHSGREL